MDSLIQEGIRSLALQGTGWVVACFVTGAVVWLFNRLQKIQSDCATQIDNLHEKRLAESQRTWESLHELGNSQLRLADSINARTESLKTIADLVTRIERDMSSSFDHWQPRVKGLEDNLGVAVSLLRQILDERGGRR